MPDEYCWSDDEESFHGHFATREEAETAGGEVAARDLDDGESRTIETGLLVPMPLSELVVGASDALLTHMAERAEEMTGDENASDQLWGAVSTEAANALEMKLEAVIDQWAREYNVTPKLSTVEHVVEHVVTVQGETVFVDGEALS